MINLYIFFFLLSFLNMPMPGNTYRKSISVPFFGGQTIETEFKDSNKVDIRLSGHVNENGTATYNYNIIDESVDIELCPNLNKVLKKYKSDFILSDYDPINEIIEIKLIIKPIFFKTKVELLRIK